MGSFQGTQEGVRNSRGKRAISVRAIEVLLYKADQMKTVNYSLMFDMVHVYWVH